MKVLENITIYKCDFCKKELKRKHAMVRHEERCSGNPVNQRPCLNCQHFEMVAVEYVKHGYDQFGKSKTGHCMLKDILMPHPKTEYSQSEDNIDYVYLNDKETEQVKMPKNCAEYKGFYSQDADTNL